MRVLHAAVLRIRYEYDPNGNVTRIWTEVANATALTSIRYQWDALNRLTNVINGAMGAPNETHYSYDPVGNLQNFELPNHSHPIEKRRKCWIDD
jgi:hypothetical protein